MNPRMKEKGMPTQSDNDFQIRNPWIPLTPGKPILSGSDGISIDRNRNQLGRKKWSDFFELLDKNFKQTPNCNGAGNNFNLNNSLNHSNSSQGIAHHQMGNAILQTGPMNQNSSSNGMGDRAGNGIMQIGNNYNLNEQLNKNGSFGMGDYQMQNGILQSGQTNQIGNSNATINRVGNGIMKIGNNYNLNEPLNRNSSYRMDDYLMGNEMLQSASNFNLKRPMNQFSSSNGTKNHTGDVIVQGGNNSNFTRPLYQGSGTNSMSGNQMGNRISQGGNNFIFTGYVNQITSSNGTGDQIGNGIMRGGNNSTFSSSINQISSPNSMVGRQMGNINLGHYENSQTQANRNNIQSFSASNMSPIMVPKTDSIISSSLVNLNMRPLSSPRGMNSPNAPLIINAYSEVDSSWTEGNFTSLLLGDEIPDPGQNNNWLNSNNSPQMINDGFHIPVPCDNNINSPPRRTINSFPFAPPTPDHANILEKHRQAEMLKFLVDDGSFQEHNKMENLLSSIGNEAIENHCSELLQTIVNPPSNVISIPQAENEIINERGDQDVIDLNETPKQKVPKRRKHRPKVVREGKPKRTPKPKTPNNGKSEETPSRKRKYVRKNKEPEVENATPQEKDAKNKVELPTFESREESCRKRLNFDFEKAEKGESQCTGRVQLAHYQGNPPVLDLNLNYTENQVPVESLAGKESHDPAATSEIISYDTLDAIAKKLNMRNNKNQENQNLQGELNKNISRPNVIIERSKVVRWKSTHQMVERDVGNFKGFMSQEPLRPKNQETITLGTSNDETFKKQKTENDFPEILCGPEKERCINGTTNEITTNAESFKKKKLTALNRQTVLKRRRERQPRRSTKIQSTDELQSVNISKNSEASGYQLGNENFEANMQNNWIETTSNPCRVISFCSDKVPLQEGKDTSHPFQQPPVKTRGRPKAFKYSKKTVDEITSQLQSLTISGEKNKNDGKDKYALVPYEGGGAMVSYEAKKRKPRPKVDLDPETGRIWKLLMGKEGTEADDAENKDKEKWWEEERRVFHGRAESFIARMHLVQGDRRFSPWKGSVIDSIVGVFLTQNVSDQLSSSAFMALAAQFPLCSTTPDQTSDQSGTSIITQEPEIQGVATEFNIITKKNTSSPQNSSDSSVHHINGEIQSSSGSSSEGEESNNGGKSTKNNDLSSFQNYNKQSKEWDYTKRKQGSDKFNNLISFSPLNHPISSNITSMQNSIMPPGYFQMLMASQVARSEGNCFEISREECKYSFLSKAPEMTKDTMSTSLFQQNNFQNTQMPNIDPFAFLTKHRTVQNSNLQQVPQIGKDPFSLNNRQVERTQIYESEQKRFSNPSRPSETVITSKTNFENQVPNISNHPGQPSDIQERNTAANKQVVLGEKPTDENGKGQAYFSGETNDKISAKKLNTSQNHEKEKRDSFDWDSLRRMVQSNGGGKEKSVDASDSMDYEAMRCADVNKISNSIRMRGMNHMLAERIKDFLNRVVTDHGRLDLEWLRDVPADKSKDYLLSIRGLGLKSVECVRLLTLHHLAFPVDTNVGRIAVRLGWVPLQPLPESLQLHLLEMYPVLETVQKYLWPRLCKLDQKTLYELHYQLITFGKVFCTKSKPNCNACPMRGECRHFASAFASARLALPAPEEKGIVGSTIPITTDRSANTGIKPLLLQPLSINIERELMVSRCEPIIEEPATPEPDFTEITETDIEDAFYEEDPDEIPTIRLNVEQLEINLRNFMEEHTDLNEGDMSKALVALTPEVASIPLPKLKYVLRLRTERQVYVLPDTHPLVKRLDKREPDDPSPYLLALLAPGEEASSGQPSGKKNESKGSEQMCNEECCSVDGEANTLTVRGTLLIPCRTAMRGSFPLNGTYFQVNEVFADHESSINPIDVPRKWLWNLEMRTVFFGTSATSIFRGMTTKEIQNSFWRGFVCVRGFDQKTRAPRPLNRNLHFAQGKTVKTSNAAS